MGVAVSNWRLASAVAQAGQLGVVSGTLLAAVLVRRLQDGDRDGMMRHALGHFPIPGVMQRVLDDYFLSDGKPAGARYKLAAVPTLYLSSRTTELIVAATFAEVFLAKEGHSGLVGINLLEKIQFVTLPSLYGAMLAGVDYVLMGAGIPRSIPGVLDRLAGGHFSSIKVDVQGAPLDCEYASFFRPSAFCGQDPPKLKRPHFLAIVSSAALASMLMRISTGKIDGFVIETDTAGGHNAPPRGTATLNPDGEPVYGPRDAPDLKKFQALGLPFWLAGSFGQPGKLGEAIRLGAQGIQLGTAFAFCQESGMHPSLKERILQQCLDGPVRIFTDPVASPTGFPFKVLPLSGTLSDPTTYALRKRICDLGYLRRPYETPDGNVGYRCPAEPVNDFVQKQGVFSETVGRKCLCNGLLATVGHAQARGEGGVEPAIVTAGKDIANIVQFLPRGAKTYTAHNVIFRLLEEIG